MHLLIRVVVVVLLAFLPGFSAAQIERQPVARQPATSSLRLYQPTDEIFANPERGWLWTNHVFCGPVPISAVDFDALRDLHVTIVDPIYVLDEYRDGPISDELLATLAADFALARAEGVKLFPRFAYNWLAICTGDADATVARIRQHAAQLAPVLESNADLVVALHVGFMGLYGEMHSSSNGLIEPGTVMFSEAGIQAFDAILDAVPLDRSWVIRYPQQKRQLFAGNIAPGEAFGFTDRARVGLANHGFAADETDFGTWSSNPAVRAVEKAWAEEETRFVPQFGEPGAIDTDAVGFDPAYVLSEVERFHYTGMAINQTDTMGVGMYDAWRDAGIFDEMSRRFGYRYELLAAQIQRGAKAREFELIAWVRNDGFAVPINRRATEIVLRSKAGDDIAVTTNATDVRVDFPEAGETRTISLRFRLPAGVPAGTYELLLWLPDESPLLRARPEYAVRLANVGVWEPETGMNRLGLSLGVD